MNKKTFLILTTVFGMAVTSCKKENTVATSGHDNPLIANWETPYQTPPFELIKNEHFEPAILEGIKEQQQEIDAIIKNNEPATFENTIVALDNSGVLLGKVASVFYNLTSSNTNDTLQKIAQNLAPKMSEHRDNINLNEDLFKRVKKVYDDYSIGGNEKLALTPEQKMLLDNTYKSFVRSGANLSVEDKDKLRKLNSELSLLNLKYGDNLLAETNAYELVIENKEDLAGLPSEIIEAAAAEAKSRNKDGVIQA